MMTLPDQLSSNTDFPHSSVPSSDKTHLDTNPPRVRQPGAHLSCDLSQGGTFYPSHSAPPVPVIVVFGSEPLCECQGKGTWDFDRAISENPGNLIRSVHMQGRTGSRQKWSDVLFQLGERAFLYGAHSRIHGYASSPAEAERIVQDFTKSYGIEKPPVGGSFQLIRKERYDEITCENVDLGPATVLSDEDFALHYPSGTGDWHKKFVSKLKERRNGLSILEGSPGTGKTSYLRHLMGQLKETHQFYFIPPTGLKILEEPEFIGFWSSERDFRSDRKLVVILEDADDALMTRETDNRDKVSAILNLSDGMLSDFLCLHVICTMNCTAADIDPALMRPGRLVTHRVFKRLLPSEASRLSSSLGKNLIPAEDYSLAEVFADEAPEVVAQPLMGFSA